MLFPKVASCDHRRDLRRASFSRMKRRVFLRSSIGTAASAACGVLKDALAQTVTLRAAAEQKNLLAGSAVSHSQLGNSALTPILAEHCNIVVAENEMKWGATHPEPDRYDFAAADDLVAFAAAHNMKVRG